MAMIPTVKRLKKDLIKAGFIYNPIDDTFKRVKSFTGLSTKLYMYNHKIDMSTGTLNAKYWEPDYKAETYTFDSDVDINEILSKCLDN